ncbi:protoporphyrinogen/coproporphyrinogen oxidase [Microbacterium sp. ZW T5_56]|uniref:protoporphyrinogen/coproporphyrinogen oxidase n=1 Tax=Microbacterium sp. ZW T5_56 TaxID=3378081 RepID=UPI00385439C0
MSDVSDLVAAAQHTPVVVIGGGIGGLVAAYECAKVGMPVTLLEASERLGGSVRTVEVGGIRVDAGAVSFAADGAVDKLVAALGLAELGLDDQRVAQQARSRFTTSPRGLVPLPDGVLGIPANPFLTDVVRMVGWGGAWRGYLDRLRPPLTIGHENRLGALVCKRMGAKIEQRLVAPVTRGSLGLGPDDVDVSIAAPDLNPALTRQGSLSGAVAELLGAASARPRLTLAHGMETLVAALERRISELGGRILTGTAAESIVRAGDTYRVTGRRAAGEQDDAEAPGAEEFSAAVVVVAADEHAARPLLRELVTLPAAFSPASRLTTVTAIVDADSTWGAGVYPQLAESDIASIDDLTAQWRIGDSTRVVRARLSGVVSAADASAQLQRVLGVAVRDAVVVDFEAAPHREQRGFAAVAARLRDPNLWPAGLGATGAWLSGTGLDSVVTDAQNVTERLRRGVLFS